MKISESNPSILPVNSPGIEIYKDQDIKLSADDDFLVKWKDLSANIFDDGRFFCAVSYDGQDCCTGMIVNAFENPDDENPTLCVMRVFKLIQESMS